MFNNSFKTAWRNVVKNKAFSLINIAGLGLGMACSLLIFLWVQDEQQMDKFALLTISVQTIKAALANPVKSLRTE